MPPPISRMSRSSSTILGFPNVPSDIAFTLENGSALHAQELAVAAGTVAARRREIAGGFDVGELRKGLAAIGIDRSFGRRARRELETLERSVTKLDRPHDRIGTAQRLHRSPERHDVGVMPHFDCVLRTDLHARIALPALLRLLVVGAHGMTRGRAVLVERHEIV